MRAPLPGPILRRSGLFIFCSQKFSKPGSNGPASNDETEAPLRVQDTRQVPLRRQLARIALSQERPPPKPAVKTAFRRKKPTLEEQEEARQEAARQEQESKKPRPPGLRTLFHTKNDANPAILLVDGYNVIGRWLDLHTNKETTHLVPTAPVGTHGNMREQLLNELVGYSKHRGVKILCAFDAVWTHTSAREMLDGIDVVYTEDADLFLGAEAKILRQLGCPRVIVVSDDSEIIQSNLGNEIWPHPCMPLLKDMLKSNKDAARQLKEQALIRTHLGRVGESVAQQQDSVYGRLGYRRTDTW